MGDGQHVWAAAEWVLMIRNCFVREEAGKIILCSGVLPEWVGEGEVNFGKTPTTFGPVSLHVSHEGKKVRVSWEADWWKDPPQVEVRMPEYQYENIEDEESSVLVSQKGVA